MLSLNLKLQSAATRSQARNIDHELKRIEANEFKEMLDIVQVMFLIVQVHNSLSMNPLITAVFAPNLHRNRRRCNEMLSLFPENGFENGSYQYHYCSSPQST